tara:strand:+ start:68 stop:1921 length:1854 start_codon:yes stop_codon:yes gene_type:complete
MNKNILIIFFYIIFSQAISSKELKQILETNTSINKSTIKQNFSKAKTQERLGNWDIALELYIKINYEQPGNPQYFQPIKRLLIQKSEFDMLLDITQKYVIARNNEIKSQFELLDVYIKMNNKNEWENIINNALLNHGNQSNIMKALIQKLVLNNKYEIAYSTIKKLRLQSEWEDFFSLEMGAYFGIQMAFEESINEYLIYLNKNPSKVQIISDKIMIFPDDPLITKRIEQILINSEINNSYIILSDLYFKNKEYDKAYSLLNNHNNFLKIFEHAQDLVIIGEYERSEKILLDILNSNASSKILKYAVFEIAKIFESKMINNQYDLNISGFYKNNPFLTSPFLSLKDTGIETMYKAINLYDSLRVLNKDPYAIYRLGELRFRVLGDLDGASRFFKEVTIVTKDQNLINLSKSRIVDIYISKGNLDAAEKYIINHYDITSNNNLELNLKYIQIQFLKGNLDITKNSLMEIIEKMPLNKQVYNDILEILTILIPFERYPEYFQLFAECQHLIIQNKRTEAIQHLNLLYEIPEIFIQEMCFYQQAWLTYLQGNIQDAKNLLNKINNNTIFSELAIIFYGEIEDYYFNNFSNAINIYLEFLEKYPKSIYYDDIRIRLKNITS